MSFLFSETKAVAAEFKKAFVCLACKSSVKEPYFTGVCDHLLCKPCLSKSNLCPICKASFFQKECHMSKMMREAIIYADEITNLIHKLNASNSNDDEQKNKSLSPSSNFLPDLDVSTSSASTATATIAKKSAEKISFAFKMPESMSMTFSEPAPPLPSTVNQWKPPQITSMILANSLAPALANSQEKRASRAAYNSKQKQQSQSTAVASNNTQNAVRNSRSRSSKKVSTQQQQQHTVASQMSQFSTQSRSRRNSKRNTKTGETALHLAVVTGDIVRVKEILDDPMAEINVKDFGGCTPLHEAVNQAELPIIKLLVESGANLNASSSNGNTALHEAAINEKLEICKYLLESGANPTLRNNFGMSARDIAKKSACLNKPFERSYALHKKKEKTRAHHPMANYSDGSILADDLDTSMRPSRKASTSSTRSRNEKKFVVFGTGMEPQSKLKLAELAQRLSFEVAKEFGDNVTHVIYHTENKLCTRTITYMKAILKGIWIVGIKWLEDSIGLGEILDEVEYEALGSNKHPKSNGPFKGRMNASCQLFEDCSFYLSGEFRTFEKSEFARLLQLAGAKLLKREPKLDRLDELITIEAPQHLDRKFDENFCCSNFILFDATKVNEIKSKYLLTVKPSWLFACIDEFKVLHPESLPAPPAPVAGKK